MKYPSVRFVFDRKHVASKTKLGLVQLEVSWERRRKWVSAGVRLYAGQWDDRRMVVNSPEMVRLNRQLVDMRQRVLDWLDGLARMGESFDFGKLEKFLDGGDDGSVAEKRESFLEYARRCVGERGNLRESTKAVYLSVIAMLEQFGKIVEFDDLTRENVLAYDDWLRSRGCKQSTVHASHKVVKVYVNEALREGLIGSNPYSLVKIEKGGDGQLRRYLTDDEVRLVADAVLENVHDSEARDLFLFQCYTGMAYVDMTMFDFSRVVERNGRYVVHDVRRKTGEGFYVVLMSPAVEILRRYGFKLPMMGYCSYNWRLRRIGKFAGLKKGLTSHMGRHTFAVMALNHGVRIESLARMMGHSDIKTTQIYARVLDSEVEREFDRLDEMIGGGK